MFLLQAMLLHLLSVDHARLTYIKIAATASPNTHGDVVRSVLA